jgi:hypothetical protein
MGASGVYHSNFDVNTNVYTNTYLHTKLSVSREAGVHFSSLCFQPRIQANLSPLPLSLLHILSGPAIRLSRYMKGTGTFHVRRKISSSNVQHIAGDAHRSCLL